jgi:hypothetical protein
MLSSTVLVDRYLSREAITIAAQERGIRPGSKTKAQLIAEVELEAGPEFWWKVLDSAEIGRTTLSMFQLRDDNTISPIDQIRDKIAQAQGFDAFELLDEAKEHLGSTPVAVAARVLEDGRVFIYWVRESGHSYPSRLSMARYEEDEYAFSEFVPGDNVVYCWANATMAGAVVQQLQVAVGSGLGRVPFDRASIEALRGEFDDVSVWTEKVTDSSGSGFSTLEASKRPEVVTLEDAPAYQQLIGDQAFVHARLRFADPNIESHTVSVQLTGSGNVWFQSYIEPETRRNVLSILRAVAGV